MNDTWTLVGRQSGFNENPQLVLAELAIGNPLNVGNHFLIAVVHLTDHGTQQYIVMFGNNCLYFRRKNIKPGMNDQFLAAPGDVDITGFVQPDQVAGIEKAICIDGGSGGHWIAVIAAHDIRTTHVQLTNFTVRDWLAVRSN